VAMEQLVRKIHTKRSTSNAWKYVSYFYHSYNNPRPHERVNYYGEICVSEMLPPPLNKLYFNTRLPYAWARLHSQTSTLEPERIMQYNWEVLFLDASNALAYFEAFEQEIASIFLMSSSNSTNTIKPCFRL
jgi:hypothetical protein